MRDLIYDQTSENGSKVIEKRELKKLRDSFMGRIPETQRSVAVKFAWHEVWSKISRYMIKEELMKVGEAMVYAANAHGEQKRSTGDPYIVHCLNVASILADMQTDFTTVSAALLHDVLEDTSITGPQLVADFSEEIFILVDGVTKLGKLPFKSFEDYQSENLRKMFLVMAKDIRVVLIKLADRLHNMRTLGVLRKDKQLRIAKETLEIYAPLAHRLGIYQVKRGLEDLAFKFSDPEMYYEIKQKLRQKLPEREKTVATAIEMLQDRLKNEEITARIKGRAKHFYSIYEKMNRKHLSIDQLYDLLALRVIVESLAECYSVLGIVHAMWNPIPGQFDDYIANPKNNLYQSLHTTVVGPSGEPLEIQIRTWEMHWLAEYGIAAHWRYKGGSNKLDQLDEKLTWIRQALESDHEEGEPTDFLERLKEDVFSSEVFVFTPKGEVVTLPNESTPIDFAYAIHTEIGSKCVGAMVNNRIVPTDYKLKNGDIVKIITSPQGSPSLDWLKIVRSSKARGKIRSYFRQQVKAEKEEKVQRGKEALAREMKRRDPSQEVPIDGMTSSLNKVAKDMGFSGAEDLFFGIGSNTVNPSSVAHKLLSTSPQFRPAKPLISVEDKGQKVRYKPESDVIVEGAEGVLVNLANCCMPVPGDQIIGFSTRTRGISVHRVDCSNIENALEERKISVVWGHHTGKKYPARLKLEGVDRPGLFSDVAQALMSAECNIIALKANVVGHNQVRMKIEIEVKDLEHLYLIIAKLNNVKNVITVFRG
ncbi:MAG: bifunctional (p)ppGpp synthetase/guanosine-3',5'-bis(diphosphate) 3'-pyrophosphohydrolase [Synergistales bacterium]|nr:bifunctional (p)ppGpp synthetase/guanosine-3',5'-bis(diphosphate) 3'-pyrophosphohydrolase [Synergistales bacterium]